MHGAVGEVNYRPSRSLGIGVNTDKEGAWFVMLSAHTLEGKIVSGLRLWGWLWLGRSTRCRLRNWWLRGWCLRLLTCIGYVPRIDLRVPTSIKFAALYIDRYRYFLSYLQGKLVYLVPEEGEADLARVLPSRFEDVALLLPLVASLTCPLLERKDQGDAP